MLTSTISTMDGDLFHTVEVGGFRQPQCMDRRIINSLPHVECGVLLSPQLTDKYKSGFFCSFSNRHVWNLKLVVKHDIQIV